jgi:hypothetical protein
MFYTVPNTPCLDPGGVPDRRRDVKPQETSGEFGWLAEQPAYEALGGGLRLMVSGGRGGVLGRGTE